VRLLFDRGTVLLRDPPAGLDGGQVPGALWDPRVRAFRAPAYRHRELAARLVRLGVRFSDETRTTGQPVEGWSSPELRPYQETALKMWTLSQQRGVIVLPTGSGKTRVAIAAMARSQRRTLIMVPTRVLVDQWRSSLAKWWPGAIGCYGNGARELGPITVATFESAFRHMAELGNRFELLVVDEIHHFGHGMRDEALEMCLAPARLGLSATPGRLERVSELVGPVVYELGIEDLAGSALAELDRVVLHVELEPEERAIYERLVSLYKPQQRLFWASNPRATWSDFVRAASRSQDGRRALAAWREAHRLVAYPAQKQAALTELLARHRDARILIFTADVATACAVSRQHLIMPLTASIVRREREAALDAFRQGRLTTLVSARVLNEGVDVPDAEVGIILGGTLGAREHVQRIGRLLRPAPGKRATSYELVVRQTAEAITASRRRQTLVTDQAAPLLSSW
jgi:superfamily II DNA or RNA helicase